MKSKAHPCHRCRRPTACPTWCRACSDARKSWYAARKAMGLCCQTGCARKAKPPHAYCKACLARKNPVTAAWKRLDKAERRKAAGRAARKAVPR